MQRKVNKVDANSLHAADEAASYSLETWSQHLNLATEVHITAVEVQHIVGAGSAAHRVVHVIHYDAHVLADALHGNRVPVAVVHRHRVDPHRCRTASAVEPVLNKAVVHLQPTNDAAQWLGCRSLASGLSLIYT